MPKKLQRVGAWLKNFPETKKNLVLGYFGTSTGAAAALQAASDLKIAAIVSRDGRPDLAMEYLPKVKAPTLLIVGGNDDVVIELNETALKELKVEKTCHYSWRHSFI